MSHPHERYTMKDAEAIRKAAMRVLLDVRLAALAKVRDGMNNLHHYQDEEQRRAVLSMLNSHAEEIGPQLETMRAHLESLTARHMAEAQLADGVTAKSIAEFVGIDLEEFAKEAWQGFEENCRKIAHEGASENV